MDLRDSKLITLFLLGAGSLLFGLVTLPLRSRMMIGKKNSLTRSLLLCGGAGALLATSLLHILPHSRTVLAPPADKLGISFLPELVICSGFFLLYILEELMNLLLGLSTRSGETLERKLSVRRSVRETGDRCEEADHCHSDIQQTGEDEEDGNNASSYNPKYEVKLSQSTNKMFPNYHSPDSIIVIQSQELNRKDSVRASKKTRLNLKPESEKDEERSPGTVRDFLIVLSLSTHSLLEGLVVGLEQSTAQVWTLFIAVALHKFILTFTVCLELQESGVKTSVFLSYLAVVSLVSPLGAGIGISLTETGTGLHHTPVAVVQGLAGGALLYSLLFRVLARERLKRLSGLLQAGGVILGFLVILTVEIFGYEGSSEPQEVLGEEEDVFYRPFIPPLPPLPPLTSLTNTTDRIEDVRR